MEFTRHIRKSVSGIKLLEASLDYLEVNHEQLARQFNLELENLPSSIWQAWQEKNSNLKRPDPEMN